MHLRRLARLLLLFQVAVRAWQEEEEEASFTQFESDRFFYSPSPTPQQGPWRPLSLPRLHQLSSIPGTNSVLGLANGSIYVISGAANRSKAEPIDNIKPLPWGSSIGVFALRTPISNSAKLNGFGIVACTPSGCSWYSCSNSSKIACTLITEWAGELGAVQSLAVESSGTSWLASSSGGLLNFVFGAQNTNAIVQPASFGQNVIGNVSSIALLETKEQRLLAVATNLAVYYDLNEISTNFSGWQNVGAVIDDSITSIAFVLPKPQEATLKRQAKRPAELWISHKWCLNVLRTDNSVDRVSGEQGLPVNNITALVSSSSGVSLWIASRQGLALYCPACSSSPVGKDEWRFFASDRWVVNGVEPAVLSVCSVLSDANDADSRKKGSTDAGSTPAAWVATAGGIARVYSRKLTLQQKAAEYLSQAVSMTRYAWVGSVGLKKYGDTSQPSIIYTDGDNDGLWTGMLISSQAFRFAVTGDEEARVLAWKYFKGLEFLHNVTNTSGFIARTAVKCGDPHQNGDSGICPHGSPNSCGWVNSSVCFQGLDGANSPQSTKNNNCCWVWKRDTSSDEVTGHVFTLLVVHELLARNAYEKERAARLLCDTVAYLQDGGYVFVDPVSGKGTSWGYWDADQLNGVPGKPNERGENSLELLGFLAAAAKVCDSRQENSNRFGTAFAEFVVKHGYSANSINALATSPLSLAFFDVRLAFMSFHNLIMSVPELCRESSSSPVSPLIPLSVSESSRCKNDLLTSVKRYFEQVGATVDGKNNNIAGTDGVYRLMINASRELGLQDPEWQLRRYPSETIDWPAHNSDRIDVKLSADWARCPLSVCGAPFVIDDNVLPADEALTAGSSDFVTEAAANSVNGGGGYTENAPNSWLLTYWFLRFYNLTASQESMRDLS